jgi:sugar lactone lactonase YvrE
MNNASKIIVSLLMAGAPLVSQAITVPSTDVFYVANVTTPEIDIVNSFGAASLFASLGGNPPLDLAFNGNGSLFAATEDGIIYQYDSHGNATTFANSGLNNVNALAFGPDGNLYAANLGGGAGQGYIEKYNSQGVGSVFAMTGTIQPSGGLAFDNSGNLYVAEDGGSFIEKYDSHGNGALFNSGLQAYSMAFYNNYLYVATASDALYKVDSLGNATLFANTDLSAPVGMAFDPSGNLFVVNANNKTIAEFNSQGTGSIVATESFTMWNIAIVPEPGTWAVLALGGGIILVQRRLFFRKNSGVRIQNPK